MQISPVKSQQEPFGHLVSTFWSTLNKTLQSNPWRYWTWTVLNYSSTSWCCVWGKKSQFYTFVNLKYQDVNKRCLGIKLIFLFSHSIFLLTHLGRSVIVSRVIHASRLNFPRTPKVSTERTRYYLICQLLTAFRTPQSYNEIVNRYLAILRPGRISFFKDNVLKLWTTLVLVRLELEKTKPVPSNANALRYSARNENSVEVCDFTHVDVHGEWSEVLVENRSFLGPAKAVENASFKGVTKKLRRCTVRGNRFPGPRRRSTDTADVACKRTADPGRLKMIRTWVCEKSAPLGCHANADQLQRWLVP